ncbi:MAG: cyanophycinase [Gemmatirosa sp.]
MPSRRLPLLLVASVLAAACAGRSPAGTPTPTAAASGTPRVGPAAGAVMIVGGGQQGPEVLARFIALAGGPDALIAVVPTAGGDSVDPNADGSGAFRAAGARNVVVYHTTSRAVADADSFVARIANARGVWFGGGRQFRLVNSYMNTRSQRAFEAVLARGGVVGGSSAGATILGSYLVRGAPSSDNRVMNHPEYLTGFGYLRNVAIDQHVVARERLPDLHDSLTSRRPDLLGLSEDEGTAWVVRGDTGEIIGRNKAFVYNGRDANDPGRPFLTLRPGDRYDLAARRVIARAIDGTPLTQRFVDELFAPWRDPARGGATVLVAQDGKVLVNAAYGVPPQRRHMPETAMPNVPLLGLGAVLDAALGPDAMALRRALATGGMQRVRYDSATRSWAGNVDDLYRFDLARTAPRPGADTTSAVRGFAVDSAHGMRRLAAFATPDGRRAAWVRYPQRRTTILLLTSDDAADARGIAQRIADRLFAR